MGARDKEEPLPSFSTSHAHRDARKWAIRMLRACIFFCLLERFSLHIKYKCIHIQIGPSVHAAALTTDVNNGVKVCEDCSIIDGERRE